MYIMNTVQSGAAMGVQERRARQKEGVREEILDAARTLFVKEGYEHVSIRKIAEKIEYAPGTIYLYFRDKAEILERLCEETFSKLAQKMHAINADPSNPLDGLRRGLRTYIQFGIDNPNHYIVTFVQAKQIPEHQPSMRRPPLSTLNCENLRLTPTRASIRILSEPMGAGSMQVRFRVEALALPSMARVRNSPAEAQSPGNP